MKQPRTFRDVFIDKQVSLASRYCVKIVTLRTLLIAGTNFSGLVGRHIWMVLTLAIGWLKMNNKQMVVPAINSVLNSFKSNTVFMTILACHLLQHDHELNIYFCRIVFQETLVLPPSSSPRLRPSAPPSQTQTPSLHHRPPTPHPPSPPPPHKTPSPPLPPSLLVLRAPMPSRNRRSCL